MSLVIVLLGILLLIFLIGYFKLNTFITFIIVSVTIGLALGMDISTVTNAVKTGIGNTLGFLVIILGFGAMLGKIVADSGAAQRITTSLIDAFGEKYIQWALVLTGFIVGIPMFYSVGFVILVPLVFSVAARTKLPLLYVGLPILASLSVTHGYLPPHPAPSALAETFGADLGTTLLYGIIVAIPAIILGGPVFSRTLKKYNPKPLEAFFNPKALKEDEMPSLVASVFSALLPVILLALTAGFNFFVDNNSVIGKVLGFLGDPFIAMLISVVVAIYILGIRRNKTMNEVSESLLEGVKGIAMIMLIIGGAGALKQILIESGVSQIIADNLITLDASPLILAWGISAVIRVCVGSATVAGLTSAGIVFPLIAQTGADPSLMVLATGSGSLMFSHLNDSGFWMFKEYFNLSVKDTLKTWSIMETIVSVTGIIGVLILSYFV
ncbi:Gnt-I system high-affinity gluconate transporter [Lutibacter oceani]|uniref:Gnt-I system high-affinity gluconate transporter n=1 Tax=Lutibacter oceani TaxID=1853311 RepID=A0A3D9RUG1_9FLAO|nr:gluconate:H+ symporter [Lutibacter oceani]REE83609.1 Gnt-I system high-affinity gluconate transporter [Lutibacter oceani]